MIEASGQATPPRRFSGWRFWTITGANVAVCVLLLCFIYLILQLLGAFAAGVEGWPVYVSFGVGLALTAISWPITRSVPTRGKRRIGYVLNGGVLLVYLMLLVVAGDIWLHVTRRLFLVPAGFQGELYVVHVPNHGQAELKSYRRIVYRFPNDGVLVTQDPDPTVTSDEYSYVYPDGHLQRLNDAGPGTLPDTSENRANTTEVVTYFSRTSPASAPNDCAVEEISIGTRAFLLARHSESPPPKETHPGICH